MLNTWVEFNLAWSTLPNIDPAVSPTPYPTFEDWLAAHDTPFVKYNETDKRFEIFADTRAFNMTTQCNATTTGLQDALPAFVPPAAPVAPTVAVPSSQPILRLFFNSNLYGLRILRIPSTELLLVINCISLLHLLLQSLLELVYYIQLPTIQMRSYLPIKNIQTF